MSKAQPIHGFINRLKNEPRLRWIIYVVLAVIFGLLVLFPQPFVARSKIVPQDTSSSAASTTNLLGALGAGSQSIGSLLTGGRPSNDLYLIIGRSDTVTEDVIRTLKLVGPNASYATEREAKLSLSRHVDVHLLLGGVLEIETKLHDKVEAERITTGYANAISRQLAQFGRQIIVNKQRILKQRFRDAADRVAKAEAALSEFRRINKLADPEQQLGSGLAQRARLESQLSAKQVELQALLATRGPESVELMSLQTEIAGLRRQVAQTTTPSQGVGGPNVAGLSGISLRYLALYRNYRFVLSIYEVYQKSSEQVEVEELAAESASYIQTIDPAHIDAERQFNTWAIAALLGVLLMAFFFEWYGPATGLFSRLSKPTNQQNAEFEE